MLTGDILLSYTGEGRNEDRRGPPELQMQQILQTHDSRRYELYDAVRYARRHRAEHFIRCEGAEKHTSSIYKQQFKPYIALCKRIV